MENGASYKEFDTKPKSSKWFHATIITVVTVAVCSLIVVATWVALVGTAEVQQVPIEKTKKIVEEIIIVEETPRPEAQREFNAKFGKPIVNFRATSRAVDPVPVSTNNVILEEVNDAIKQDDSHNNNVDFSNRANNNEEVNSNFIHSLVELGNNVLSEIFSNMPESSPFNDIFNESSDKSTHSRKRRSIVSDIGLNAIKYLNYITFGKFMFDEAVMITEYAVEGRKLSSDPEAFFLDNSFLFGSGNDQEKKQITEKIDNEVEENSPNSIVSRPPSAFDDGWTPMVNKVSLSFITEMLTTLLNLMREYLMKDHVMECLWFMFCKDMNHQAKYTDPMGYLARVNSVGLKVLVDREGKERDTVNSVWQALTQWEPMQCDTMFPRCDGSKALEIVNEVANGAGATTLSPLEVK